MNTVVWALGLAVCAYPICARHYLVKTRLAQEGRPERVNLSRWLCVLLNRTEKQNEEDSINSEDYKFSPTEEQIKLEDKVAEYYDENEHVKFDWEEKEKRDGVCEALDELDDFYHRRCIIEEMIRPMCKYWRQAREAVKTRCFGASTNEDPGVLEVCKIIKTEAADRKRYCNVD